jgi:hypothetical protein
MKLIKTAEGKQNLKITKSEWEGVGRKAGWIKSATSIPNPTEPSFSTHFENINRALQQANGEQQVVYETHASTLHTVALQKLLQEVGWKVGVITDRPNSLALVIQPWTDPTKEEEWMLRYYERSRRPDDPRFWTPRDSRSRPSPQRLT